MNLRCFVGLMALGAAAVATAATPCLQWSTDREPVSYTSGEPMVFRVRLVEDGKPLAGKTLKWVRSGDDGQTSQGEATTTEAQPVEIKTAADKPGFVRLEIGVFEADGTPLKDGNGHPLKFEGGAGVEPVKLEGYAEPADFDGFWKAQKARLAAVPLKASLAEVASKNPDFQVFDVKVDCAGGKPVSGYLSVPKNAQPKSLPALVSFLGYSVCGANQEFRGGTLVFQINAHGIENGREPEYYRALQEGALKGYAFNNDENAKPETAYFNGMMLRVMRALEFVKSRAEWDGKTLIASGGSQGGLQAVNAAALDRDVTQCFAYKPWCADLGGIRLGRLRGWRPDYTDAIAYYDIANQAKRVTCETFVSTGLGDYVCPPSGVSVLYNNLHGPKTIEYIQGSTHGYDPPNPVKQTLRSKPN